MESKDLSLARHLAVAANSAAKQWSLALVLFLPTLFLALMSAIPIFFASQALGDLGPWPARLARGDVGNAILELTAGQAGSQPAAQIRNAVGGLTFGVFLSLLAIPLQGLFYNVLVGGVLSRFVGNERAFWPAVRRWGWAMLRFGILSFVLFLFLVGLGLVLIEAVPVIGRVGWWLKPMLSLSWIAVLNGLLEAARASMVVLDDDSAFAALGRGVGLLRVPGVLGPAVAVWLALAVAGGGLTALSATAMGLAPVTLPVMVIAVQLLSGFAGALLKLGRLAMAVGISQSAWPEERMED